MIICQILKKYIECYLISKLQQQLDENFMVYSSTPTPRTRTSSTSSKETIIASGRNRLKNPNLQIVTQALHIPPKIEDAKNDGVEEINEANANEVERLKRDMKKLKDYLKTSVQERKMLVKKIGTLNERVNAAHVRKSVSPEKSTMTESPRIDDMSFEDKSYEDLGIQCSLQDNATHEDPNFIRFASELNSQVSDQNNSNLVPTFVNNLNISGQFGGSSQGGRQLSKPWSRGDSQKKHKKS